MRFLDRVSNGFIPLSPWLNVHLVEPWTHTRSLQLSMQLPHCLLVFRAVAKEDPQFFISSALLCFLLILCIFSWPNLHIVEFARGVEAPVWTIECYAKYPSISMFYG